MKFSKTIKNTIAVLSIILVSTVINANYRPIQESVHRGINWVYAKNNTIGDALYSFNQAVFNGSKFDLERQTKNAIFSGYSNVVMVRVQSTDPAVRSGGTGTGFFVKVDGDEAWIMTNHHVISESSDKPDAWKVTINTAIDMWTYDAEIIGIDEIADIAIVKITKQDNENWQAVEFEEPDQIGTGDPITVIGHGMSLAWSSTSGIVSYNGRYGARPYALMLQVDAVVNQGNSGGPVLSSNGKVVGVAQSILSPGRRVPGWDGVGFAVSAEQAMRSMNYIMSPQYIAKGYVPYAEFPLAMGTLGLEAVKDIDVEDRHYAYINYENKAEGAVNTLGEDAGFIQGDIVLTLNGENVRSSWAVLKETIKAFPGDEWKITVLRDDEEVEIIIALREVDRQQLLKSLNARGGK